MITDSDWQSFYDRMANSPPRKLLLRTLEHVKKHDLAIDLGCGNLVDTRLLVTKFKQVEACDTSPLVQKYVDELAASNLKFRQVSFLEALDTSNADLISAQFALPFVDKKEIEEIFRKIPKSLTTGGIFCGHLFGARETQVTDRRCDHTLAEVEALAHGLEVILIEEIEKDVETLSGLKNKHIFNFILRKQ